MHACIRWGCKHPYCWLAYRAVRCSASHKLSHGTPCPQLSRLCPSHCRYGAQELFADEEEQQEGEEQKQQEEQRQGEGDGEDGAAAAEPRRSDGGEKRDKRIVWDDAALDRLLDRSELLKQQPAAEEGAANDSDFMSAFRYAAGLAVVLTASYAAVPSAG
jgi:hypothetical protein